jgi:hypothetical protein
MQPLRSRRRDAFNGGRAAIALSEVLHLDAAAFRLDLPAKLAPMWPRAPGMRFDLQVT